MRQKLFLQKIHGRETLLQRLLEKMMNIEGWEYYNHAMIPTTAPHEVPDMTGVQNGSFWKMKVPRPLLARWTTNFDCKEETNWWYVIKDTPFDVSELKAKRRYEINKGLKNFDVKIVDPLLYEKELCNVHEAALEGYPLKYRPRFDENVFRKTIREEWHDKMIYAGFEKETGKMCGYALLSMHESYISFNVLKTVPQYEKHAINAAIVHKILTDTDGLFARKQLFYICDGERNISHETGFQDYLEKYFGFRKAYCVLHVSYRPLVSFAVTLLYPFRRWLRFLDKNGFVHNIISVLHMEELKREAKEERR